MTVGFIRNMRCQALTVGKMLLYTLATMLLLMLWQALTTPLDAFAQQFGLTSPGYLLLSSAVWSAGEFLSIHTTMLPTALSMSTTRKASFWGCQAAKALYSLGVGVIGLLCTGVVRAMQADSGELGLTAAVLAVFLTLFFASLTELASIVNRRFGKWGTFLYMALCGCFGMTAGISFAMSGEDLAGILYRVLNALSGSLLPVCCGALAAATVLLGAVSGMLYRKSSV